MENGYVWRCKVRDEKWILGISGLWDVENGRGDMRDTPIFSIKKYTKYQNS
jgi:hypothetical protein